MNSFTRINRSALSELIVHRKTHIISMILLGIMGFSYMGTSMYDGGTIEPNFVALFFFFIALAPLFFVCINVFKDMHDVPTADVQMAMPLSSTERFFSKLMTICYIWILPYIFFHGVGNIISIGLNSISDINRYDYYGSTHLTPASIAEMYGANLKVFLWGLSIVLFIVGTTVLCSCCIGSKAESIYLPIALMLVISVLPVETRAYITEKFADISTYSYDMDYFHALGFGAVFYDIDETSSVLWVLLNCLISLAMLLVALFAYRKRDATTVGYPVVFKVFFEIIVICSLATLFELAHASLHGVSGIAIFVYYVGSVILRMIVSRKDISVLKVLKWTGVFAAYYVLFIVYSYAACITGGFGAYSKLPDTSAISPYSPVIVNCHNYNYDNYNERQDVEKTISFTGIEDAEKLCSKYIGIQNRNPGYFSKIMFTGIGRGKDFKECYIRIEGTLTGSQYDTTLYSTSIYLDQKSCNALFDEIRSLR